MANIDKELKAIEEAIFGEDVRSAIHDGIKAVNDSATDSARAAEENASLSITKATEAESYAKGGTGSRPNEDTDNAKYYYEMARGFSPQGYEDLVLDVAQMKVNKQNKLTVDGSTFDAIDGNQFESVEGVLKSKLKAKDIYTDNNDSIQKKLDELSSFESITYKGTVDLVADLPTNAENGWMYYCKEDQKHYVCVNDPLIDLYEWHEYHTFDDNYLITVEKVKNDLETQEEGFVLDARQGYELKQDLTNLIITETVSVTTQSSSTAYGEFSVPNGYTLLQAYPTSAGISIRSIIKMSSSGYSAYFDLWGTPLTKQTTMQVKLILAKI